MTKEEIKDQVLKIQNELGMKDSSMAGFMGISVFTYKNCKSEKIERNEFNINNLETLKKNISEKIKKILK